MTMDREEIRADQLSRLIDALNNKEQAESNDSELQELAELALLVKQAAVQTKPTPETIDYIARQLEDESKGKQSKRRFSWLYSGAAGIAAAVMLVAVTNFMPVAPDHTEQQVTPQVQIAKVVTDTASGNTGVQQNNNAKADIPNVAVQVQQTVPKQAAEARTKVQPNPPAAKQAPAQAAQGAGVAAARYVEIKQARDSAIPAKNGKASSVDNVTGSSKQVYAFENNKEAAITQKAKESESAKPDNQARVAVMKETAEAGEDNKPTQESGNQITAAKDGHELTGKGELSKEKVQETADSSDETEESEESGKD